MTGLNLKAGIRPAQRQHKNWVDGNCRLSDPANMAIGAIRNVDYVILLCDDVQRMKDFYHGVLGFEMEENTPHWVKLRVGSCALTLRPRGPWRGWDDGPIPEGSAAVQLAFCVGYDDVDRSHEHLVEKGIDIIEAPDDQHFGHRTLFFRDPENNVLEIYAELADRN